MLGFRPFTAGLNSACRCGLFILSATALHCGSGSAKPINFNCGAGSCAVSTITAGSFNNYLTSLKTDLATQFGTEYTIAGFTNGGIKWDPSLYSPEIGFYSQVTQNGVTSTVGPQSGALLTMSVNSSQSLSHLGWVQVYTYSDKNSGTYSSVDVLAGATTPYPYSTPPSFTDEPGRLYPTKANPHEAWTGQLYLVSTNSSNQMTVLGAYQWGWSASYTSKKIKPSSSPTPTIKTYGVNATGLTLWGLPRRDRHHRQRRRL